MTPNQTPGRPRLGTRRHVVSRTAVAVLATASLIGACSSSDGDADDAAVEESTDDGETADGGGGAAPDDVGSGVVRIDGVENGGFVGDCEMTRNFGADDVGDLSSSEGLSVIVAVDNVESQPAEELNFVMINDENFRVVNVPGTVESITESGARTSSGSRDYVTIVFAGTLEDGRAVEAELLCELQNKF